MEFLDVIGQFVIVTFNQFEIIKPTTPQQFTEVIYYTAGLKRIENFSQNRLWENQFPKRL